MRILAAPDKFRGTVSAAEVVSIIGEVATICSAHLDEAPMADGGEGTLEALGGFTRSSVVTGPLGEPVIAPWRFSEGVAVIEMASASGLTLAGGASGNDPMNATTVGTGELISEAIREGAHRVVVGAGGSATTDGGSGALKVLPPASRLRSVELVVACDVRTGFLDAAEVFGPQKGASTVQIKRLNRRLSELAEMYLQDYGVDVTRMPRTGAAGGLAGGLAAIGAELVDGFKVVADDVDLRKRIADADIVITGEGRFDATSLKGKVVGGVLEIASESGVPVLAIVGSADSTLETSRGLTLIDLTERFGSTEAKTDVRRCIKTVVTEILA